MAATTVTTRAVKGSALTHTEMDTNWNRLNNVGVGVGHISMWPTPNPPDSTWLRCEGQQIATASYPDLFNVIGYTYGGSGANFRVPDTRGIFIRGWDHGAGVDPNRTARTNRGDGTTGDFVGTRQGDSFRTHFHDVVVPQDEHGTINWGQWPAFSSRSSQGAYFGGGGTNGSVGTSGDGGYGRLTSSADATHGGGLEVRPLNMNLLFIIKALL